jgi:hypothetical protein
MKTLEYRFVDKSTWADGPWHFEPDKRQWQDSATGLFCLVLRHDYLGHFCGYVSLPLEHAAHGLHHDGITDQEAKTSMKEFRKNIRRWHEAGYPPLTEWHKQHPLPERDHTPFPGVGEYLANIEVHGGLSYADVGNVPTEATWQKVCERLNKPSILADAAQYPLGHTARWVRKWAPVSTDYDTWKTQVLHETICLEMEPGEPTDLWFFGFDCCHAWDIQPGMDAMMEQFGTKSPRLHLPGENVAYRDLAFVEGEVAKLAKQLNGLTVLLPLLTSGRGEKPDRIG